MTILGFEEPDFRMVDAPSQGAAQNCLRANDISLMALRAAEELERCRTENQCDLAATRGLVEVLRKWFSPQPTPQRRAGMIDFGSVTVAQHALSAGAFGSPVETVPALAERMTEIIGKLESVGPDSETEEVAACRDFCLAFSESALEYRISLGNSFGPEYSGRPKRWV
jgi:hypothetical protein